MTIHDEAEKLAKQLAYTQHSADLVRTLSARLRAVEAERDAIERQFSSVSDGYSQLHVALEEAEDWNREVEARMDETPGQKMIRGAQEALEYYANPEIYKPHPHGPAFDRRDLSYTARAALALIDGENRNG